MKIKKILILSFIIIAGTLSINFAFRNLSIKSAQAVACPGICFPCSYNPNQCCQQDPAGGFVEFSCVGGGPISPAPSTSATRTPTPSTSPITISGELNFAAPSGAVASCPLNDVKALAGARITVYDNSNSNQLGQTTATFNTTDNKTKYTITVNKVSSNSYKLITTESNFFDINNTFTATGNITQNIRMRPKNVKVQGTVVDEKNRAGISDVFVEQSDNTNNDWYTGKDGYYHLQFAINLFEYWPKLNAVPAVDQQPYLNRLSIYVPSSCLTNYADITLVKDKICEKPGGRNVLFCWWGRQATALKRDQNYTGYWVELADIVERLRTKTQSTVPTKVNISSALSAGAWASPATKDINFSYQFIIHNDYESWSSYILLKLSTLPHEFAHTYNFTKPSINDIFKPLVQEGRNIDQNNPSYTAYTVFKTIESRWIYYIGSYGFPDYATGYPGTNEGELYAETFATMWSFDSKLHSKVADTTYPADLRAYAKKVHNAAAGTFPHGNTIAIQDLFNKLVASINE